MRSRRKKTIVVSYQCYQDLLNSVLEALNSHKADNGLKEAPNNRTVVED